MTKRQRDHRDTVTGLLHPLYTWLNGIPWQKVNKRPRNLVHTTSRIVAKVVVLMPPVEPGKAPPNQQHDKQASQVNHIKLGRV
jgi:hypothetical protein